MNYFLKSFFGGAAAIVALLSFPCMAVSDDKPDNSIQLSKTTQNGQVYHEITTMISRNQYGEIISSVATSDINACKVAAEYTISANRSYFFEHGILHNNDLNLASEATCINSHEQIFFNAKDEETK